ncbi:MAG: hypothetical protein L0K86_27750 [Actinomycetia bacterium]|nr:hypothetical protein [Actinomycetes bacterium]
MRDDPSTIWVHRPRDGKVAWGAAVLAAPGVPFLSFLVLLVVLGVDSDAQVESRILLAPVPWLVLGGGLACLAYRIPRGIGLGLIGGAVASLVLALATVHGGWR